VSTCRIAVYKVHDPIFKTQEATWLDQDDDMGLQCTPSDQPSMVAVSGRSAIGRLRDPNRYDKQRG
jgi:hypothetical protein